jgi:hypothetical protein
MKKLFLSICLIVFSIAAYAGNEKDILSEIKNVTVYLQGAQVTREGSVFLQKGKTILLFKGLPATLSPESIQVKASDNVLIASVTQNIDYLNKTAVSKEIQSLNEHRKALIDSIKIISNYKNVYQQEKEMILANKSIAGDNGVNINDLQQAADFFHKRLTAIETATHRLDNTLLNLKTDLVSSSKQLMELNAKIDQPASQIRVVVTTDTDVKTTLQLGYFIADAGWIPSYDVRIKDVDEPLCLFYKARVFQNTGEAWEDVKLTLSTGNPSVSSDKPELLPYFLTFDNYYTKRKGEFLPVGTASHGKISGRIIDGSTGEPLIGACMVIKGTTTGAVSDLDGNYSLEIPGGSATIVASFIGFSSQELYVTSSKQDITLKPDVTCLNEVVVTGYGVSGGDYEPDRRYTYTREKKIEQIPLAIDKQQLTTEFKIDIPYSIPSDNQPYDVTMVEYDIEASYKYTAVPKLSPDAFLIARIPDFTRYDLLNGPANIFFKGIYQGESYIDPETSGDTLTLSIGRDKDIVVMRENQKDFSGKSISGISKKEQKAWLITVKNNKSTPVDITIEDQYPVSKMDEIKVDLIEDSDAEKDKSSGKLTWNLSLSPKERKTIDLKYSVRYPSGRQIIVD